MPPQKTSLIRETLVVGPLEVSCHILACVAPLHEASGSDPMPCLVIDPGDEAERIIDFMETRQWQPAGILLTHAHFDHIGAVDTLRERYPQAKVYASKETSRRIQDPRKNLSILMGAAIRIGAADIIVEDGTLFSVAGIPIEPTEAPGHDPGEMVYGVKEAGWLFTGDVLFAGGVGRTDFPDGDHDALINAIHTLLARWPDSTVIFPGHGSATTVGKEKRMNPYL